MIFIKHQNDVYPKCPNDIGWSSKMKIVYMSHFNIVWMSRTKINQCQIFMTLIKVNINIDQ